MNTTQTSSFGMYEASRILVPGFYFASLAFMLYYFFVSRYLLLTTYTAFGILVFLFLVLVSGLTMYAKESTKRRQAFLKNQPSSYLQDIIRRFPGDIVLNESEARQLYFYILNHHFPSAFHDKIFFFGTVYHIMNQIRRTSLWFTMLSALCLVFQVAASIQLEEQRGLICFFLLVVFIYLLNVKYNKADRKMQENYQDQIFWLQMNPDVVKHSFDKYQQAKKGGQL